MIQAPWNENIQVVEEGRVAVWWSIPGLLVWCSVSGLSVKTAVAPNGRKVSMPGRFLDPEITKQLPLQGCCCGTRASCVEDGGGQHVRENMESYCRLGIWRWLTLFGFWFFCHFFFFETKMWKHSKLESHTWSYDYLIYTYYQNYYPGSGFFLCYKGLILCQLVTPCDF